MKHVKIVIFSLILLIPLLNAYTVSAHQPNFKDILCSVDYNNILNHIDYFSSLGSRVTGYSGSFEAATYIRDYFSRNLSLRVEVQEYEVVVPIVEEAYIEVNGERIRVYPLWPNYVQTCSTLVNGISGRLVYASNGVLDGLDMNGSIVVLPFDSEYRWIDAAELGALAVVFVDRKGVDRLEVSTKFLKTPIKFTRVYVRGEDADKVIDYAVKGLSARLVSRVFFRKVKAYNVIGFYDGDIADEPIIVVSHYDSWSIVPEISPGADESVGVSVMLELARVLTYLKPRRSIWFVALSGHWQGLAGAREFVEEYFFSGKYGEMVQSDILKPRLCVGLELSSSSPYLALTHVGWMYMYGSGEPGMSIINLYNWFAKSRNLLFKAERGAFEDLGLWSYVEYLITYGWGLKSEGWWASIQVPYILDSEAFAISGLPSLSFVTAETLYPNIWTPHDSYDKVDLDNIKAQAPIILSFIYYYSNVDRVSWGVSWNLHKPSRLNVLTAATGVYRSYGFVTLVGKVVEYSAEKGWYKPVPNALITVSLSLNYPFACIYAYADENGVYEIHGLSTTLSIPGFRWRVEAWVIDEENGEIIYSPDQGRYGVKYISNLVETVKAVTNSTTIVFRSTPVELFDVIDVQSCSRPIVPDPRFALNVRIDDTIKPLNYYSLSEFMSYGSFVCGDEPVAMVFVPVDSRFVVVIKSGRPPKISGYLINASASYPEGYGYFAGERTLRLTLTPLLIARDLYSVASHRYGLMAEKEFRNIDVERYLELSSRFIREAEANLRDRRYGRALAFSILAWMASLKFYRTTQSMIFDSLSVSIAFFALLIPFAYIFEKLVIKSSGFKRIISLVVIFASLYVLFTVIHSGPSFFSNPYVSILGILIGTFLVATLVIYWQNLARVMEYAYEVLTGRHKLRKPGAEITFQFLSYSISYMSRRKLRTFLTILSVVAITISLISLTSISSQTSIALREVSTTPCPADAILIKGYTEVEFGVLDWYVYYRIAGALSNVSLPRIWYYPQTILPNLGVATHLVGKEGDTRIGAVLGLSSLEFKEFLKDSTMLGVGFEEYDLYMVILSNSTSAKLGVSYGDRVWFMGYVLPVRDVLYEDIPIQDVDANPLTPFDAQTITSISLVRVQQPSLTHLPTDRIAVVPERLARKMGGYLSSIVLLNVSNPHETAGMLAQLLKAKVYLVENGRVKYVYPVITYRVLGFGSIPIILAIGVFNIIITLLGALKERISEMSIFTSIGLSPSGAIQIFIVEGMVYGVVGVVIGYISGLAINRLFIDMGLLPESYIFNFSSLPVITSMLLVLTALALATIYPALLASKIVTPSFRRRWKMRAKAVGDETSIPIPIRVTEAERHGLINFLFEFYDKHREFNTFIIRDIRLNREDASISMTVSLAPFEMSINQAAEIRYVKVEDMYALIVNVKRLSGKRSIWIKSNYKFVDNIRKQALLWRTLSPDERRKYMVM